MRIYKILIITLFIGLLTACGSRKKDNYSLKIAHESKDIHVNDSLTLSIAHTNGNIDSVQYFYAGKFLKSSYKNTPVKVALHSPLGRRKITAKIYSEADTTSVSKKIVLHTNHPIQVYTYKVVKTYPHDPNAFTQGLEFHNGILYESTGRYGVSSLHKVNYKTGEVLKKIELDRKYFGEGLTIMNNKIYLLTWREGVGFVYDLNTFQKLKTFDYGKSKEGWGLCNDGKVLYKSDGTNRIWILDSQTLEEKYFIEPVTRHALATKVNELEWVNGKIYANTWQKPGVLIINPETGAVEGIIDFRGLKKKLGNTKEANVLNGIAYNYETGKLYVTGKFWDTLFQVELVKK